MLQVQVACKLTALTVLNGVLPHAIIQMTSNMRRLDLWNVNAHIGSPETWGWNHISHLTSLRLLNTSYQNHLTIYDLAKTLRHLSDLQELDVTGVCLGSTPILQHLTVFKKWDSARFKTLRHSQYQCCPLICKSCRPSLLVFNSLLSKGGVIPCEWAALTSRYLSSISR